MFERFTRQARSVVVQAQQEARDLGHPSIGTEHLLLGVLAMPGTDGAAALARCGVSAAACRRAVEEVLGRGAGGVGAGDAEALRSLGIDLESVRGRAEETFGPGALEPQPEREERPRRRFALFGRRRERGHIPFSPRAKRALERSLREAVEAKDRQLGVEHLLLGLLDTEDRLTAEVLRRLGTGPDAVRAEVLAGRRRAA